MNKVVDAVAPQRMGSGFRWLLSSSWISNFGDGIAVAAGPLLVASQTDDPLLVAMAGLLARSIATNEWAGTLFLIGFAALFAWQVGGFITRNRPLVYTFDDLPKALLP